MDIKGKIFGIFDRYSDRIIFAKPDIRIQGGPFEGMKYLSHSVGSLLVPKILGTYELELKDTVENLPHFDLGLDVGAAEGYYAVGFLLKNTCDRMVAWEMTPEGQALIKELATSNGVADRISIEGTCDPQSLGKVLEEARGKNILMVVDCEGYEGELLESIDPELLARTTLIIETHDFVVPGVHAKLLQLLKSTHKITEFDKTKRRHSDLTSKLSGRFKIFGLPLIRRVALVERRFPNMRWMVCKPAA